MQWLRGARSKAAHYLLELLVYAASVFLRVSFFLIGHPADFLEAKRRTAMNTPRRYWRDQEAC